MAEHEAGHGNTDAEDANHGSGCFWCKKRKKKHSNVGGGVSGPQQLSQADENKPRSVSATAASLQTAPSGKTDYYSVIDTERNASIGPLKDLNDFDTVPEDEANNRTSARPSSPKGDGQDGRPSRATPTRNSPHNSPRNSPKLTAPTKSGSFIIQRMRSNLADVQAALKNVPSLPEDKVMPLLAMNGTWVKDFSRSEPLDELCKLVELSFLLKAAMKKSNVIEMRHTQDVTVVVRRILGIMDVVETTPWNGESVRGERRDMRRGGVTMSTIIDQPPGGFSQRSEFNDPVGGVMFDEFLLVDPNTLQLTMKLTRHGSGASCCIKNVFTRKQ